MPKLLFFIVAAIALVQLVAGHAIVVGRLRPPRRRLRHHESRDFAQSA
jgi:hypothetical protein